MSTVVPYSPTNLVSNALFNFDIFGLTNFKLSGTVNLSISDSFTLPQYIAAFPAIPSFLYTSLVSGSGNWTQTQISNIELLTSTYSNFINLGFTAVVNYPESTPAMVGTNSDINISLIYRTDWPFAGASAVGSDNLLGYAGSAGDIVLNINGFGSQGTRNDTTLGSFSYGWHALMHELGHSLGLGHPHQSFTNGVVELAADFQATAQMGFDKLGFAIDSALDMNKVYFSIMSYDDQKPATGGDTFFFERRETVMLTAISVTVSMRLAMIPNLLICATVYVVGHMMPLVVQSAVGKLPIVAFVGLVAFCAVVFVKGLGVPMPLLGSWFGG